MKEINESTYEIFNFLTKKPFMFSLLIGFILVNVFFCPNLLNNKDIKLNDMSYLLVSNNADIPAAVVMNTPKETDNITPEVVQPMTEDKDNKETLSPNKNDELLPKPKDNGYSLIGMVVLISLLGGLVMFIVNNYTKIMTILDYKQFKDQVYNGYELLEDSI